MGAKTRDGLTQKQEKFCLAYIETGSAAEAFRRAYDAKKMKPEVIHVKASELLAHGMVSVRIEVLRQSAASKAGITLELLNAQLIEDRAFARKNNHSAAAVTATMGMAKLNGFLVEGRQKERSPFEDMSDEELDRAIRETERAIALAKGWPENYRQNSG